MSTGKWAKIALVCVSCHVIAFGLLHLLEPELSPISSIISDYSQTKSSGLATVAFLVFAAIWACLALALSQLPTRPLLVTLGQVLFGLAVLGIVTGAVAPSTADPRTSSLLSSLQNLVARPGLFLGVLLVSVGLRRVAAWADVAPKLIALSVLAIALLIATVGFLLELGLGGVAQRTVFLALYAWAVLVSLRIIKTQRSEQ
jgi:hypothetical protein